MMLSACQIQVGAPDFAGLLGRDVPGAPDQGEDVGSLDGVSEGGDAVADEDLPERDSSAPGDGFPRETPSDPGGPGSDAQGDLEEDFFVEPALGNAPCQADRECLSGRCEGGRCRCLGSWTCEPGDWCDEGDTAVLNQGICHPRRGLAAGCQFHEQCETGACDPSGYCAWCAPGGTGCEPGKECCFGACREGCLGCAVAPPPEPVRTACATGCYDPEQEFCGPAGPEPKRFDGMDCQFNDSWCQSGICYTEDLWQSFCAQCRTDADCRIPAGGVGGCLGGYCAVP